MDTLINVAVPVFGIVLLGFFAGRVGVLGAASAEALNRFVYFFALPPVLFAFTARAPVGSVLNWPFIAAIVGGSAITVVIACFYGKFRLGHNLPTLAVQSLAAVFPNTAYMGLPLFLAAFGPNGVLPAIVATLVINIVLIGGAIGVLEASRMAGPSRLGIFGRILASIVRNPLLIAPFLGMLASTLAFPVPKAIWNLLDILGASAGPAALFALGLSLVGRSVSGHASEVATLVMLKLIVQPAATFLLATQVLKMDDAWSSSAVLLSALPTGALVFVIAQQYDTYVQRTSACVVISTVLSLVTVSVLMGWLGVG